VAVREGEARPPRAQEPDHHEQRRLERELLADERPHPGPAQGERDADEPADDDGEVRAEREPLEVERPLHQRLLDDPEPLDHDQDREHLDHALQLRHVVHVRPPAGAQEARRGEHEAPREVEPERGVEVRVVELLALDDRGQEALLEQHPDERDVDQRDRDDAEVVRAE
jgi:hypothetical protein